MAVTSLFLEEVAHAFGDFIDVGNRVGSGAFEHVRGAFAEVADLLGHCCESTLDQFSEDFFGQLSGGDTIAALAQVGQVNFGNGKCG